MEYQDIQKAAKDYWQRYRKSNERGKECIKFVRNNEQWEGATIQDRVQHNKATLTYNNMVKYVHRFRSQVEQVNFDVGVFQTSINQDNDNS